MAEVAVTPLPAPIDKTGLFKAPYQLSDDVWLDVFQDANGGEDEEGEEFTVSPLQPGFAIWPISYQIMGNSGSVSNR